MTTEEKILELLEKQEVQLEQQGAVIARLEQGQQELRADVQDLKQGQEQEKTILAQHQTALKAIGEGHHNLMVEVKFIQEKQKALATAKDVDFSIEAAKREIQGDISTGTALLIRQVQSNTKRITALEETTGSPNPDKH